MNIEKRLTDDPGWIVNMAGKLLDMYLAAEKRGERRLAKQHFDKAQELRIRFKQLRAQEEMAIRSIHTAQRLREAQF